MPLFSEEEAKTELGVDDSENKEAKKEIKLEKPKAGSTAKPKNQKVANTKSAAVKKTGGSKNP